MWKKEMKDRGHAGTLRALGRNKMKAKRKRKRKKMKRGKRKRRNNAMASKGEQASGRPGKKQRRTHKRKTTKKGWIWRVCESVRVPCRLGFCGARTDQTDRQTERKRKGSRKTKRRSRKMQKRGMRMKKAEKVHELLWPSHRSASCDGRACEREGDPCPVTLSLLSGLPHPPDSV